MFHGRLVLLVTGALLGCPIHATFGAQPTKNNEQSTDKTASEAAQSATSVDYIRDIRPILSRSCYACHGPDADSREAELRLDRRESALGETTSGDVVIVPGEPEKSELFRRISSEDQDEWMPPFDSGKSLTPDQIALIRRWIGQGAPWKEHWAFAAPRQRELPPVSDQDWPRNAIDYFIQARLDQQGWKPSPKADEETLIRRVTFDLTGLPPTPAEVDAFLADDSPVAYQRVVDRLLRSPRYGEHMARFWLDGARYGDTHGLHLDNYREMWLYRDWVVRAFNDNIPYDQFVIEQLAGDLLPNPTTDQLVATGFSRCHVTTNEGGSIEEEVYVRNVIDRVSTTGTVFLGLTLGCAVCHDHKFDPISQKEFYQLFAFFNSLDGPPMDGNVKDTAPIVNVPSEEQAASLGALRETRADIRSKRSDRLQANIPEFPDWLSERFQRSVEGKTDPEIEVADGLVVHCDFEAAAGNRVINKADPAKSGLVIGSPEWVEGRVGHGLKFASHSYVDLGDVGDFQDEDSFSYGAWIKTGKGSGGAIIAKIDIADLYKGYDLSVSDGIVSARLSRRRNGYSIKISTKNKVIQPEKWHHVFVTYNGSKLARGVVIYVDGEQQSVDVFSDSLKYKDGISNSKPLLLGRRDTEAVFEGGRIDDVRVYERRLSDADVQAIYLSSQFAPILATLRENVTEQQLQMLRQFYLIRNDSVFREFTDKLDELIKKIRFEESKVPTTLVFREQEKPRDAFVLIRGQYDQHGEKVDRQTPDCLPPMIDGLSRDRMGLARWIVSSEHPLTSRVAVNRFWQQAFGIGLVETSEDFGSQGTPPSHPDLLDWLAVEFRENGWDIKALMRQIVMSATYRQSSYTSPTLVLQDPENRLLARGPRFRLDAEMLRDQALALSGLLVPQVGGPSVKPPQPEGLWQAVGFTSSNTVRFVADTEHNKIHRRSLYTFHKRTSPPPEMTTFDAPSRESTCVRRERTNTPLQALLLLNDPQYFEAARALAKRVMQQDRKTTAAHAAYLYRLCTARHANDEAIAELVQLFEDQLAKYQQDKSAAKALLGPEWEMSEGNLNSSDLAAWTIVANLMLNLDEVVTKN